MGLKSPDIESYKSVIRTRRVGSNVRFFENKSRKLMCGRWKKEYWLHIEQDVLGQSNFWFLSKKNYKALMKWYYKQ